MRASIERRIGALEATYATQAALLVIAVRFVRPGRIDEPANTATLDGMRLTRCNDESEAEFMERIGAEARTRHGVGRGVAVVLMNSTDIGL